MALPAPLAPRHPQDIEPEVCPNCQSDYILGQTCGRCGLCQDCEEMWHDCRCQENAHARFCKAFQEASWTF